MASVIIGLGYKKQQGKDTFAHYLRTEMLRHGVSVKCMSFAQPLKAFCRGVFGLSSRQTDGTDEEKNSFAVGQDNPVKPGHALTARQVLQEVGVRMKEPFPGIWAWALMQKAERSTDDVVIVTDVRFPEEANMIRRAGGMLFEVFRPDSVSTDSHVSETAMADFEWDRVIVNDGDLVDLMQKARNLAAYVRREKRLPL